MTTYRVPVADSLLDARWLPVRGLRRVSVDGPWPDHPRVTICTFEDDGAPAELEGKLVEPILQADPDGQAAYVAERIVVGTDA